jgi:SAM-dependent methyltransferase
LLKPHSSFLQRWPSWHTSLARRLRRRSFPPPLGQIDFGDLRQSEPLGRETDQDAGHPVDRYYIEQFFHREAHSLKGQVLAIGHDHSAAVVIGGKTVTLLPFTDDAELLQHLATVQEHTYGTLILWHVLHHIYELDTVVRHIHRVLTPGGILLATVPGTCYAAQHPAEPIPYWRFTRVSLQKLIEENFPARRIDIETWGNVVVALAHLHRIGIQQLTQSELAYRDEHYPLILTLTAEKRAEPH